MNKVVLLLLAVLGSIAAYGQVDVTKYASSSLFAVKPAVDINNIESEKDPKASQGEAEIQKGIDFWLAGEYNEAQYLFEQLKEEYPGVPGFSYYLGMINYEMGGYEESMSYFKEALKIDPLFLDAKYMVAIILLESDQLKEAKVLFKELEVVPQYAAFGEYGLALYYLEVGNTPRAKNYFMKTLESDPSFLQAYIPLITMNLYFDHLMTARKLVEKALKQDHDWQQGIMIRAMISLLQDEGFDQFEKDINYLITLAPDNYHYYSLKGFLHMEIGEYHEAVKMFREAYNLGGDSLRIGEHKFNSKFKKNEGIHRSLNYYFENYALEPEARLLLDQGICLVMNGAEKRALILFDSALKVEENPVIYLFKGSVQRTLFIPHEEVIQSFTKAIKLDSNNWIAYSYRGEEYLKIEEFNSAYQDFTRVIKLKPRTKEGYKIRGNILVDAGKYANAYRDYSYGLSIDSTDVDLYFNRAITAYTLGAYDNANMDLNAIIKRKPIDGDAYYWKYKCELALGDSLQSIHLLDSASKHSKFKIDYHVELLKEAERLMQPELITNAYNRMVKYNRHNYEYLLGRAKHHLNQENIELAIQDLRRYTKLKKGSGEAHYYLSIALTKSGNLKEGENQLKKSKRFGFVPTDES